MTSERRVEPSGKRVRAYVGGRVVADSTAALLVWEKPHYPTYFLPVADVRTDELPAVSVTVDAELDAVRIRWDAVDAWFEEDEEVFVHPRDPYKRVDVLPSSRPIRVELDGVTVAESTRTMALFETSLPTRWYFPKVDVRMDLLQPRVTASRCPYKGTAEYWSVHVDGAEHPDLAWSYRTPVHESIRIAGLVCFYNERVDLFVDGELQERPTTPFS